MSSFSFLIRKQSVWHGLSMYVCTVLARSANEKQKEKNAHVKCSFRFTAKWKEIKKTIFSPLLLLRAYSSLVKYGRPTTIKNKTHETCFFHSWFYILLYFFSLILFVNFVLDSIINVWNVFIHTLDERRPRRTSDDDVYLFWAMEIFIRSDHPESERIERRTTAENDKQIQAWLLCWCGDGWIMREARDIL